jgi:hypothetical protein
MALITAQFVKDNFEAWQKFAAVEGSAHTPDEILQIKIDRAEEEFGEYLTVTNMTITAAQKRHLLNLCKKHLFDIKHGDTKFELPPQIVLDYNASIEWLRKYRVRAAGIDGEKSISITAKTRRFDSWFNDTGEATMINSNDQ